MPQLRVSHTQLPLRHLAMCLPAPPPGGRLLCAGLHSSPRGLWLELRQTLLWRLVLPGRQDGNQPPYLWWRSALRARCLRRAGAVRQRNQPRCYLMCVR